MRISKEVSGNALARDVALRQGRGEYEWCDLTPEDPTFDQLLNRRIVIRLPNSVLVDTGCIFGQQGGKQRVRRAPGVNARDTYPPWHVAGILMLPRPIRAEPSWGDGTPIMRSGQYGITHLHLHRAVPHLPNEVHVEVSQVDVANHFQVDSIDFLERFAQVQHVWAQRAEFEPALAALIETHERVARSGGLAAAEMIQTVAELQREMSDVSSGWVVNRCGGENSASRVPIGRLVGVERMRAKVLRYRDAGRGLRLRHGRRGDEPLSTSQVGVRQNGT